MKLKFLFLPLVVVASCAPVQSSYEFPYNPNSTPSRLNDDVTTCEIDATQRVPTAPMLQANPGFRTPITTNCIGATCYTTGGQVIGGGVSSFDANQPIRYKAYQQCMRSKGYQLVQLPHCGAEVREKNGNGRTYTQSEERWGEITPQACAYFTEDDVLRVILDPSK